MSKPHFLPKLAIAGVAAGAAALSVPMEANAAYFVIDDFDIGESTRIIADPGPEDVSGLPGEIWPEDWDRTLMQIETIPGTDPGRAVLCGSCGAFEMESATGNSQNIAWIDYSGPETDLSVYDGWEGLYSADLNGGDLKLYGDGVVIAEGINLMNTGGAGPQFLQPFKFDWLPGADLTVSTLRVEIDGTDVPNLDFTVDGVKAPEPGTILGLLAFGGLGLGLKRKKNQG